MRKSIATARLKDATRFGVVSRARGRRSETAATEGAVLNLECGGKRSATPLLHARDVIEFAGDSLAHKKTDPPPSPSRCGRGG
jgi:hypothetical protein